MQTQIETIFDGFTFTNLDSNQHNLKDVLINLRSMVGAYDEDRESNYVARKDQRQVTFPLRK